LRDNSFGPVSHSIPAGLGEDLESERPLGMGGKDGRVVRGTGLKRRQEGVPGDGVGWLWKAAGFKDLLQCWVKQPSKMPIFCPSLGSSFQSRTLFMKGRSGRKWGCVIWAWPSLKQRSSPLSSLTFVRAQAVGTLWPPAVQHPPPGCTHSLTVHPGLHMMPRA
jgi:hypothetical protein